MAENLFQKLKRSLPLVKDLGWAGFAKYWMTSTPPTPTPKSIGPTDTSRVHRIWSASASTSTPTPKSIGPTDTEVLASDERIRRRLAGQTYRVPRGISRTGLPARLTMPTLIGF